MKLARSLVLTALGMTGALCVGQSSTLEESNDACAAVVHQLLGQREPAETSASANCGGMEGKALDRKLKVTRDVWDSALRRRILFVSCAQPSQCVPFLVRLTGRMPTRADLQQVPARQSDGSNLTASRAQAGVRPGQRATLIWDREGIRLTVSVVCLSAGGVGKRVNVRVGSGRGTILSAWVVNSSLLRSSS